MTTTTIEQQLENLSRESSKSDITLTSNQQQGRDALWNFVTQPSSAPAAVLMGYAGTGKSTTIGKLIQDLTGVIEAERIGVTAPTHKAVKVLRKNSIDGVHYRTVHSMLALKEKVNNDTGEITFEEDLNFKGDPPVSGLKVMIVDECSMLDDKLFMKLVPWQKRGLKLIFVGDGVQIPPVKQKDCIPFIKGKEWGMVMCELTQIIRQAEGNPILELATEIRKHYRTGVFHPKEQINEKGEGIKLIRFHSAEEKELLQTYFGSELFAKDPDFIKVIAWHRNVVREYNDKIREILYKHIQGPLPALLPGERLIMDQPYIISARNIIPNNEEVLVETLNLSNKQVDFYDESGMLCYESFRTYELKISYELDGELRYASMEVVHESDRRNYEKHMNRLRQIALDTPSSIRGRMWRQYFRTRDEFGHVNYNYAVTGHKSQGSTYDHALVLKWDIDTNPNIEERNRIFYTSCTRARKILFLEL